MWSERGHERAIEVTVRGVTLRHSHGRRRRADWTESFAWSDVIRVDAYKVDVLTIDKLCWRIQLRDGRGYEVNEDQEGWDALLEAAPEAIPGFPRSGEWWSGTVFPPFEECGSTIFEREGLQ
jgi:hypothetical protein